MGGRLKLVPLCGAAAAAAAVLALPVAAGAGPGGGPTFHDQGTFTDVDPNFCDTGSAVDVTGRFNAKVWIGETGGDPEQELFTAFNYQVTLTNPANGSAVVETGAGLVTNEITDGLESGAHTHVIVENGLRATLRLAGGGILTLDAGSLAYAVSFDADDNLTGLELLRVHGPHPAFVSDVFCEAATEALGL